MKGRPISREEFRKNYMNVKPEEINKPYSMPPIDESLIYNPVTIYYNKIVRESAKGLCVLFDDGVEYWFSKKLTLLKPKVKHMIIPKSFLEGTFLHEFIVADKGPRKRAIRNDP